MNEFLSSVPIEQIKTITGRLGQLAEEAASRKCQLFNESNFPNQIPAQTPDWLRALDTQASARGNPAVFWTYISKTITIVNEEMTKVKSGGASMNKDALQAFQARTIRIARQWSADAFSIEGDNVYQQSYAVYVIVARAFDWSNPKAEDLFGGLMRAVSELRGTD